MDDRMKERVQEFVERLLKEEITLLEIENQAIEIGDEISRQLAGGDLAERSGEAAKQEHFFCPTCGRSFTVEQDLAPLILQGLRSEIKYSEPRFHCRSCRQCSTTAG